MGKVNVDRKNIVVLVFLIPTLLFFYNNCSGTHESGTETLQSFSFKPCSVMNTEELFAVTYHPFLQRQCASCHTSGPGKGTFAAKSVGLAYPSFGLIGASRISDFAVNPGHKAPATGTHNSAEIDRLQNAWANGVESIRLCELGGVIDEFVGDPFADERVWTRSKAVNAPLDGDPVLVRYDLNSELMPLPAGVTLPDLSGVAIEFLVSFEVRGGRPTYYISRPMMMFTNAPKKLPVGTFEGFNIESLRVKINNVEVPNETTFHTVNQDIYLNQNTVISGGTMVATGALRQSDVMSISFGKILHKELPPPPPVPSLSFVAASSPAASESGFVDVTLRVTPPVDKFVTINLSVNGGAATTAKSLCCDNTLRNDNGTLVEVLNFDADYSFDSGTQTLLMDPNQSDITFRVNIHPDERDEQNETVSIRIGQFLVAGVQGPIGTNRDHVITISDNDSPATGITFSTLMGTSSLGVFRNDCARCHHTTSAGVLFRAWDMTNYEEFVDPSRRRVVQGPMPEALNTSILWQRMNALNEQGAIDTTKQMPLNGILSDERRDLVREWIENGAKNN